MLNSRKLTVYILAVLFCIATAPVTHAASTSYTPPAKIGDIYVVIAYKREFGPGPNGISIWKVVPTTYSVSWGAYNASGTVSPPSYSTNNKGFVLKLRHTKADSVTMYVTTSGVFETTPYQGSAPLVWTSSAYKQISL